MEEKEFDLIFSDQRLNEIFPEARADQFFEALYGDLQEGAYTIGLRFKRFDSDRGLLHFDLELKERPGKCLACNLTYGLPDVFSRHPIINIRGLVKELEKQAGNGFKFGEWSLSRTAPISKDLHTITLMIKVENLPG
ncbi:MAG: pancreas/duodenum homeobox protein 1 [Deltaproteobacteria bacterium]|nr:pancreas/duodenum homeobox protein 1 [Deltaproteobacteria bacterium]